MSMSISILMSLMAGLLSNSTWSPDRAESWCFSPVAPQSERMLPVREIDPFVPGEMERRRLPRLERQSVARIGARRAGSNQYYIRAGIASVPNLTPEQVYAEASNARFEFHYDRTTGNILVMSFNALYGPITMYDIVIRVKTSRPISQSFVACYGVG